MKLRMLNDPALREVCLPVKLEELESIKAMLPDLEKVLNEAGGLALAANQVGIIKRFFILKQGETSRLLINPEIIQIGEMQNANEGCLSIPGATANTKRAFKVMLLYLDENFVEIVEEFTGLMAVAVQHEIDHLDGKLYIDQLKPSVKLLTLDKHRKFIRGKR